MSIAFHFVWFLLCVETGSKQSVITAEDKNKVKKLTMELKKRWVTIHHVRTPVRRSQKGSSVEVLWGLKEEAEILTPI